MALRLEEARIDSPRTGAAELADGFNTLTLEPSDGSGSSSAASSVRALSPSVKSTDTNLEAAVEDLSVLSEDEAKPLTGFMRLPPEIRVKIYEALLIPTRKNAVALGSTPWAYYCCPLFKTPLISSSDFIKRDHIRSIGCRCPSCYRQAMQVDTAIRATSRIVHKEASAVLYEECTLSVDGAHLTSLDALAQVPVSTWQHIKHLQLTVDARDLHEHSLVCSPSTTQPVVRWSLFDNAYRLVSLEYLPNLRHITIHIKLVHGNDQCLSPIPFQRFESLADRVTFAVDVHFMGAYADDGTGWSELIFSREGHEEFCDGLQHDAGQIRRTFIDDLAASFKVYGKKLRIEGE